jgi:polysaccharide export outer membrane protein
VYFKEQSISPIKVQPFELRYQANDILSINVSALDVEAALPFNLFTSSPNITNNLNINGQLTQQTFLLDEMGEIIFPVLGRLKIGGMSRMEAIDFLEQKLQAYLKNPLVNIRLTNFRISVLGEVNRPGTYTIANEQVSLPEALALAGDLSINGKRANLLIIREESGILTKSYIDLGSNALFNSPYYFLKPNDVLYVEPNVSKVRSSTDALQYTSISLSMVTALTTIIAILLR